MIKRRIFWFRNDLRIADNPGLKAAIESSEVIPIYIVDQARENIGSASKCWLHYSLEKLNHSLKNKLNLYKGNTKNIFENLIQKFAIEEVIWNKAYEPKLISFDKNIEIFLAKRGIKCSHYNGSLLFEPWEILKDDRAPYRVFTPFYRKLISHKMRETQEIAAEDLNLLKDETSLELDALELLPKDSWHLKLMSHWKVGEAAAKERLTNFLDHKLSSYKDFRDFPAKDNISKLSPHLHFGEISSLQIWQAVNMKKEIDPTINIEAFLMEIVWREFSSYLLYHYPYIAENNFQQKFDKFPWQEDRKILEAWQKGKTGFPIIDAAMRELWQTGFMHNRCRMIVASFLTKNLMQHWRYGRDWFADCLVDADLASNVVGWQWSAGCGVDAAPYFRIFNPTTQAEKFDPEGEYIKHYVPELKAMPIKYLFEPWKAPGNILKEAKVNLGINYPFPIVNLKESREFALKSYKSLN